MENAVAAPAPAASTWRGRAATFLSIAVSVVLLTALYQSVDVREVVRTLIDADGEWVVLSVGMIIPITLLRAIRFLLVAPRGSLPGLGEAFRLTLVASAFNVFLPAKTGDLVKSYFVSTRGHVRAGVAISIAVYERLCDLAGLIFWCLLGWLIGRSNISHLPTEFWLFLAAIGAIATALITSEIAARIVWKGVTAVVAHGPLRRVRDLAHGWPELLQMLHGRRRWIVPYSLGLWFAHLCQIWMFTIALRAEVPWTVCVSVSAVALMAGQLPFTFVGLGSTDVTLVLLLSRYMPAESAAAMGVLISTRNLLPPLVGIPFMPSYVSSVVGAARAWKQNAKRAS